jgi:autotransporter-associated beta strand protein
MKSSYLSVGVCLLVIFSCLLVTAGVAQAAVYLVDRGLPTYGVYAVTGTGDVDWANRTNIGNGNYDSKDPIWAANPSWGAPELSGDDFTLPVGNLGTADPNFHVTDIRMWIRGSATTSFSQEFNNISLMVGPKGGPLTDLNLTPTVTAVHYPNGQSPSSVLWQLDYAVNLTGTSGQQFSYAIVPNGKASGGAQGYGEAYYMAFMDAVMTAAQTGHNPSGDGYVGDFFTDGTFCDTFTFPAVWGGVRAGDFDVQVLGTHSGTTYQWNDGPGRNGTFNWTDTTNWTPGTGFPNGMDDVANINAGILTMDLGGQAITVGTMNITGFWQWQTGLVNLRNGTLIFQTSGGNATLTDTINPWSTNDTISANVQLASPLTVSMPEYTQGGVGSNALKFTGVVSGNNGITKTGPGTLWLSNAANSFTGDIRVQDGALEVDNWAALPAANTIYLGGVGTVGRLYITDTATITRPLVLTGAGGGLFVNTWTGQGWTGSGQPAAASLNGVISGTGNLFIGMGYATTFNGTADNTYVGDTKVNGWANVLTTARALKGNVAITPGGMVNLASANNLDSTASVYVGSFQMGSAVDSTYGVLTVTGDFVPTIDPRSSGVLSLAANLPGQQYGTGITGTNINAALAVGPLNWAME